MKTNYLKSTLSFLQELLQILLGIFLASIGLKAFLLPNGFLDGGVTGIALLINSQTNINVSLLLVILSLPFFVLAYFTLSKRILIKSILSILFLAFILQIETFSTITEDKLLIAIFGGLFVGLGLGVTIRNGAVLDGSEILGIFINDRLGIEIGKVILVFNVILFGVTAIVLPVEVALYSILTFIITAQVTDTVIKGFENFIGVMIVTKANEEMKMAILEKLGAGLTIYKGEKGYGHRGEIEDCKIIHTIVNRIDIRKLNRIIEDVDPKAFVVEYDVNNIKGGVLRKYLERNKRNLPQDLLEMDVKD